MQYYAKIDRAGGPTECIETSTASAWKVFASLSEKKSIRTVTVFRKKTWEILSRIKQDENTGCLVQTSHPKYLED